MQSTAQLNIEALDYKFFPSTSLKVYLKACVGILDKAQLAFQEGNLERAYVFYVRYVDLCTNKLSHHPQYLGKDSDQVSEIALHRQEYLQLIRLEVPAVLKITEDLRKQLDLDYAKHKLSLAKNIARPKQQHHNSIESEVPALAKLPPSFDNGMFNHSLRYYHETTSFGNHSQTPVKKSQNSQADPTNDAKDSKNKPGQFRYYPELPQLSFPTF